MAFLFYEMAYSGKNPNCIDKVKVKTPNGWGIRRGGEDVLVLTRLDMLERAVA